MRDVTVGIVGLGSIGQTAARHSLSLGARVVATRRADDDGSLRAPAGLEGIDRILPPDRLDDLLAVSDFVVLALPLTGETAGLIDERSLGRFKPGAWLINVARGALVDDRALLRALHDGRLGGAILDTVSEEPVPASSPYYDAPNLILTPHTSWSSGRVLDRSIELFCENLRRYRAGEPPANVVDRARGY
jgi:phosphoglycerate dehydrogenase-like enzyme